MSTTESDYQARIAALEQLLNECKAQLLAFNIRLAAVEQSLQQKWQSAAGA